MKAVTLSLFVLFLSQSLAAAELADIDRLFDFAEDRYPQYFSPAGQETVAFRGYQVRYYPDTDTYMGVQGDSVYVHGRVFGVGIIYVGEISDIISPPTPAEPDAPDEPDQVDGPLDLTGLILSRRSESCADFAGEYIASARDVSRNLNFDGNLTISVANGTCTFNSNNIPNHDMGEGGAFATPVSAVDNRFTITASPVFAGSPTDLGLEYDNAVLLNGVKVDLFAAACFGVGDEKIGCNDITQPWRFDPMYPGNSFGTDTHNAHTQPDGAYHYHGNPRALFDFDSAVVSPVVGFAADGFPVFGSYFDDNGTVRKAESGWQLKPGTRPAGPDGPGGPYDGTYRDDYEYVEGSGDLDECNGMRVNGIYGYYIIDEFPYMLGCFRGIPDDSFRKSGGGTGGMMPPGGRPPPPG